MNHFVLNLSGFLHFYREHDRSNRRFDRTFDPKIEKGKEKKKIEKGK